MYMIIDVPHVLLLYRPIVIDREFDPYFELELDFEDGNPVHAAIYEQLKLAHDKQRDVVLRGIDERGEVVDVIQVKVTRQYNPDPEAFEPALEMTSPGVEDERLWARPEPRVVASAESAS